MFTFISLVSSLFQEVVGTCSWNVQTPTISLQCPVRSNSVVHLFLHEALCKAQKLLLLPECAGATHSDLFIAFWSCAPFPSGGCGTCRLGCALCLRRCSVLMHKSYLNSALPCSITVLKWRVTIFCLVPSDCFVKSEGFLWQVLHMNLQDSRWVFCSWFFFFLFFLFLPRVFSTADHHDFAVILQNYSVD